MLRRSFVTGFALALAACSHEALQAPPKHASLLVDAVAAPAYESPASWRYHPRQMAPIDSVRSFPDGRALLVGKRGERALLSPHAQNPGLAVSSALAPEDLIAVLDANGESGGGYWFVGASGTAYQAREPLGAFLRSSAPLEPLVRVTASGRSILGISRQRTLLRSDDGAASFSQVGPSGIEFVDVELASDGTGLALSVPERLWFTQNEGQTFAPLDQATIGAHALWRDAYGSVYVQSLLGTMNLSGTPPRLTPVSTASNWSQGGGLARVLGERVPPIGPDASALRDGRAVWIGGRYVEILKPPARDAAIMQKAVSAGIPIGPPTFQLLSGPWTGPLEKTAIPMLSLCQEARVAGFGRALELACFRSQATNESQPIDFYRREGDGDFQAEPFVAHGKLDKFQMVAGAGGALVLSGLCARGGSGCDASGIYLRKAVSPARAAEKLASMTSAGAPRVNGAQRVAPFELVPAAAPSLEGVALRLTFAVDGRSVYAVARRNKTAQLGIFVSRDAGLTFEVRDLDLVRADAEEEDDAWGRGSDVKIDSFAPAEDGSVSLVINEQRKRSLVVVDEQGHVLSIGKSPESSALMAAAGLRAIAIAVRTREAWESLDGGVGWASLGRFPLELCRNGETECAAIQCASVGCVVGQELSRVGWGGQRGVASEPMPPPRSATPEFTERRVLAPIACSLDDTGWQALPGVRDLPNAHDSARGKLAWLAVSIDEARRSITSVHGLGGAHPRTELVSLLKPLERGDGYAFAYSNQIEGPAALRYATVDRNERDTHLRDVDVAWDNAFESRSYHARLADGGAYEPQDYERAGRSEIAAPALLSIAQGGLYLRLHHAADNAQETWFFDGKTSAHFPAVSWPVAPSSSGSGPDVVHQDGVHLPILLFQDHPGIVRARLEHGAFVFDAETVSLPKPELFLAQQQTTIAYRGQSAGVYVQVSEPGHHAHARFLPFRASGAVLDDAVAVPTQSDLPDRPNPCSNDERTLTPRVVASELPGTRHPIVVSDPLDPPRTFLTARAVLHGTPEHPCVAMFDAEPVLSDAGVSRSERLLVDPGDLDHGWLFRTTVGAGSDAARSEYRLMKCHYDPTLEIPKEVYQAPGTIVTR
ncbi:MAG TPA: hypothetical protein VGM29_19680 [Polyangiaceae bacterium]